MDDRTDQQLLAEYAEQHSEPAFTELVRRQIALVYSAALRMTGEAHTAHDVTQAVFLALAQNAPHLDTALGELNDAERDAILLRYFERKSAPQIAAQVGITPEAAQKRGS